MKKLISFVGLFVVLAVLAWWCWSHSRPNAVSSEKMVSSPGQQLVSKNVTQAGEAAAGGSTAATSAPIVPVSPSLKEQLRQVMENGNRAISFFGKVVDQEGNPIPDVKVTFQIRYTKEVGPAGIGDTFTEPSVTTGGDGQFALTDAKGAVLMVKSVEKAGYEPSVQATRGVYWYFSDKDPYRPDPANPKIFHMWKKIGAEKLVRKGIGHAIPYDGTPVFFDLFNGTSVASGGDLKVTLRRNPRQIVYGQRNFEWELTVEAVDGGIVESTAEQMYLAPAEAYLSKVRIHVAADDPQWTDKRDIAVYLRLRGGKFYGRATLESMVGSDRATTPFSITSFVNPSGSRNLEYDPLQDVVPSARPQATTTTPKP